MGIQPAAVACGLCCNRCGSIVDLQKPTPGKPRPCHVCASLYRKPRTKVVGPWKARLRHWPNGTPYWIITDGETRTKKSANGVESRYHDFGLASSVARDLNAGEP